MENIKVEERTVQCSKCGRLSDFEFRGISYCYKHASEEMLKVAQRIQAYPSVDEVIKIATDVERDQNVEEEIKKAVLNFLT